MGCGCQKARSAVRSHIVSGNAKAAVQTIVAGAAALVGAIDGETLEARVDEINKSATGQTTTTVRGGVVTVVRGS